MTALKECIQQGYAFKGKSLTLGGALHQGKAIPNALIKIPLSTLNRHGLIAGATGTGKTKTIQRLAELLSEEGISVLLMDVKGDLSGLAMPGISNPKIEERQRALNEAWSAEAYPVELLSISSEPGSPVRVTLDELGPLLFSRMLELNESQEGLISLLYKSAQDKKIALSDLEDFRNFASILSRLKPQELLQYGAISPSSLGVILRQLLQLEQQGGSNLFGAPSFNIIDLLKQDERQRGVINILRVLDIQDKPKLFSCMMLCLLTELFNTLPEVGDVEKPKLVLFIDEAHLLFKSASKALQEKLETIIKLIRSKGVGIFFCTQLPTDIPDAILSQLGAKVQHSLRAFSAKDRKEIKLISQNYPLSEFYNTEELLIQLGIGEALVTVLNEKGNPTPLVHCLLSAPRSRMDILSATEIETLLKKSTLYPFYAAKRVRKAKPESLIAPHQEESAASVGDFLSAASKNPLVRSVVNTVVKSLIRIFTPKPKR